MSVFVLMAGGTGGHLFPAMALAQELRRRGHVIHLMTDERVAAYGDDFPAEATHIVPSATPSIRNPVKLESEEEVRAAILRDAPDADIRFYTTTEDDPGRAMAQEAVEAGCELVLAAGGANPLAPTLQFNTLAGAVIAPAFAL